MGSASVSVLSYHPKQIYSAQKIQRCTKTIDYLPDKQTVKAVAPRLTLMLQMDTTGPPPQAVEDIMEGNTTTVRSVI